MIKRVILAVSVALPLSVVVLPQARATTPPAPGVHVNGPMFCVWNEQLNISYCQYTLPRP